MEHFNKCHLDLEKLEEKQQLLGIPKHKLVQAVQHRWNSVYDMIKRLCEQQAAVAAVLHDHRDLLHLAFRMEAAGGFVQSFRTIQGCHHLAT